MRNLLATSLFLAMTLSGLFSIPAARAQSPGPSTAAQPYLVMTAQSLDAEVKGLQAGNAIKNLIGGSGIGCRVFIQHEKDVTANPAEVHDRTDDIFIFLEGAATLTLGGKLDSPTQAQAGEWRAAGITGGFEVKVGKGDMIIVPRGTPHRRVTPGQEVTLMVIKSFAPPAK